MSAHTAAPSRAEQFGEALRRLRAESGVTLDTICSETKISRRILESLESGRFQFLPEQVFSRNFVRQYARMVGADPNQVLEWFDVAWERFLVSSGSHPKLVVEEAPPGQTIRWQFWLPLAIGVLLAIVAGVAIVHRTRQVTELEADPLRTMAGLPTPATDATGAPLPTMLALEEPTPDELKEQVTGKLDLGLRVTGGKECWVRFRDREGRTEQRLLQTGEELKLELEAPVLLTLGNAAAVTVRVGASEYRNLGRPGEVLHMEVTSTGITPLRSSGTGSE